MPISVETNTRTDVVDITERVSETIPPDAIGLCTVYVSHTTAGIVVNEAESGLLDDIEDWLGDLAPAGAGYTHDAIDDNADAHLKATVLGESVTVPVTDGDLDLGTWQRILFVEGDGPRTRRVRVTLTPGEHLD